MLLLLKNSFCFQGINSIAGCFSIMPLLFLGIDGRLKLLVVRRVARMLYIGPSSPSPCSLASIPCLYVYWIFVEK
jgi:hypothetical protein